MSDESPNTNPSPAAAAAAAAAIPAFRPSTAMSDESPPKEAHAAVAPSSTGKKAGTPSSPTDAWTLRALLWGPSSKEKVRSREDLDAVRAKAARDALILLSGVVALVILTRVVLSSGQPLQVASVWQISHLICFCCLAWVSFLKVSMSLWMVIVHLFCVILVAILVDMKCGPKAGMVSIHFNTYLAAAFVGYALAEHRLIEHRLIATNIHMPASKQQADKLQLIGIVMGLFFGVLTLGATMFVLWIVYHAADYSTNDLLLHVLMPLPGVLILWIYYLAGLLRHAFIGEDGIALVFAYYAFTMMMYMLTLITLGPAAASITTWMAILGHSGFLGYSKCVYDFYKKTLWVREEIEKED